MIPNLADSTICEIAQRVRTGTQSAVGLVEAALNSIQVNNDRLVCFTKILSKEAMRRAREIDSLVAQGIDPGPLAGVPFGVKDLFDVEGLPTTAGAKMRLDATVAKQDATVVSRLKQAGAILMGTLNMDEFAYGFATVNAHFGTTHNPHDTERIAGGSSGGSAAAVAAGLVPFALGSDTNGSIRVPASLCGIWGIRPADSALPMQGVFPFVEILDTVGPFARSLADLKLVYEVMAKKVASKDERQARLQNEPLRVGRLDGWFVRNASAEALDTLELVSKHIGGKIAPMPEAEAARSASFLMTAAQGGAFHLNSLRKSALEYDPAVRDRLLAGSMLPSATYIKAMRFRSYFRKKIRSLFETFDILIAPSTPVAAPRIDQATIEIDGKLLPARAQLGIYTQPLSLAGIPIVSAPVCRPGHLPMGIQFATSAGREGMLFDFLARLEAEGLLRSHPIPKPKEQS